MRRALSCVCCLGLVASLALADKPPLQKAELGKKMVPVAMARLNADGTVSDRVTFGSQERGEEYCLVFDCFEPDEAGIPTGFNTCGMEDGSNDESGDTRWGFGPGYQNMYSTNDMEFDPAYGGRYIERMEWGWKWYVNGPGTGENCAIVFQTFEDFDDTCQTGDPNGPGAFLGGVVFWYGYREMTPAGYYWYTDSQDNLYGTDWVPLPNDGAGSYKYWFMTYPDNDPNDLSLATNAQPMLWGTGSGEWTNIDCIGRGQGPCPDGGFPPDGSTSHQGLVQWDDDQIINAWHELDECNDYTYGLCPDPLGAMWCAYVSGSCGEECDGDIDGDGDTDHADLGAFLSAWCSHEGDPTWNAAADLDGDGHVGHGDLGILLGDWGCGT